MRRFRFRLAGVERWRTHLEREARRALGAQLAELRHCQQVLAGLDAGLEACRAEQVGVAAALATVLAQSFTARRRVAEANSELARRRVDHAREQYQVRRRDRETLRRLHERRRMQWQAEALAAEQAELDELARLRWSRREAVRR